MLATILATIALGLVGKIFSATGQTDVLFIVPIAVAGAVFTAVVLYPTHKVSEIAAKRKSKRTGSGLLRETED